MQPRVKFLFIHCYGKYYWVRLRFSYGCDAMVNIKYITLTSSYMCGFLVYHVGRWLYCLAKYLLSARWYKMKYLWFRGKFREKKIDLKKKKQLKVCLNNECQHYLFVWCILKSSTNPLVQFQSNIYRAFLFSQPFTFDLRRLTITALELLIPRICQAKFYSWALNLTRRARISFSSLLLYARYTLTLLNDRSIICYKAIANNTPESNYH